MKILVCCPRGYYSKLTGDSYEYLSFVDELRRMGHRVHHYDHILGAAGGREALNDFILSILRHGGYDLFLVVTHKDEFFPEMLEEAKRYALTLAWNCDDDYRWEEYSSKWVDRYTYMVTTYRHIYEANRARYPNLVLSQWGCVDLYDGMSVPKDIPISFVGSCYAKRRPQVNRLRRELGMAAYGQGVGPPPTLLNWLRPRIAWRLFGVWYTGEDRELPDQKAVKGIWNRSRISFTPLDASCGQTLQIKGRIFDMGLSGTVMLCNRNPALYEFYEPGKEFVEFETLDECVDKARYLLSHESERAAIAERYYRRTRAEHLWRYRFERLFRQIGLVGNTR